MVFVTILLVYYPEKWLTLLDFLANLANLIEIHEYFMFSIRKFIVALLSVIVTSPIVESS